MDRSSQIKQNYGEFGRNVFPADPFRSASRQRWILVGLISLFIIAAFLADIRPVKNFYFLTYWKADTLLTVDLSLNPAMRYSAGHSENSGDSLIYILLLKLVHSFIPPRLLCLRTASVLSTAVSLFIFYRLAAILFSRKIALIFIFLLATSPVYLESMRSFGFIPLTNALVSLACYLTVITFNHRRIPVKIVLLVFTAYLLFSLYASGRLAVFLPLIIWVIYAKTDWRKAVIYLMILVALVGIVDLALGDLRFDIRDFLEVGGEWLMYRHKTTRHREPLTDNLSKNARVAVDYFLQRGRASFREPARDEEIGRSRLFPLLYTPFFLAGMIVCLCYRKKNNIFLLVWFCLFFFPFLFSSGMAIRRIVLSLAPLYLLIAVGLSWVYSRIVRSARLKRFRRQLTVLSLIFLLSVGIYGLYEFFFTVSRPPHSLPRSGLQRLAGLVKEHSGVSAIVFNRDPGTVGLIWGNPFIDPRFFERETLEKFMYDDHSYRLNLEDNIRRALKKNDRVLFLYRPDSPASGADKGRIGNLSASFGPGRIAFFRFPHPSLEILLIKPKKPETAAPFLGRKLAYPDRLSVTSEYSLSNGPHMLRDGDPITSWRISNRELGEPAEIRIDYGTDSEKKITGLKILPRAGRPEEFFRRAEFYGSRDGWEWELISPLNQKNVPPADQWRHWNFANDRYYPYYKLIIYNGHSGRNGYFLSLGELILEEADK